MTVKLTHVFKDKLPNVDEFFKTKDGHINTINGMCSRIKGLAKKYSIPTPNQSLMDESDFKGGMFELFVEFLVNYMGNDNRIGILDYSPILLSQDTGVDGVGRGENTFPAVVQAKYRSGDYMLEANADHLTNTLAAAWGRYGVRVSDDKNILIITTAKGIYPFSLENMLLNKVRVLNRDDLRKMLDNRPEFWLNFWESVRESRTVVANNPPPRLLRQHQLDAVDAAMLCANQKGKIVLPTGTGKTLIECEIVRRYIVQSQAKGIFPVIKINSPRILLCIQIFEEIFAYLNSYNMRAKYVNFNSGRSDETTYVESLRARGGNYLSLVSTTSTEGIKKASDEAKSQNVPLIVISTYHSSEKLMGLCPTLTIHDEAHNLVSREFCHCATLDSDAQFFFTATEKTEESEEGLGMNNTKIFGEMTYTKSAREMIESGEMVPPYVHIVRAKNEKLIDFDNLDKDYRALIKSVTEAFSQHQDKLREESAEPSRIGAKVLVVCQGQEALIEMFNTSFLSEFKKENPRIHIFALSSDFGLYYNGDRTSSPVTTSKKSEFINKLKALKPEDQAIIFHVDMLGEGIDIPSMTGIMPFRNCELCKLVQNIGRASRLHPEDRQRFYNGEISPTDRTKWIKPHSWVIIPSFLECSEGGEDRIKNIVMLLRNDYGFIPTSETLIDNVNGLDDDPPIDTVNEIKKERVHLKSGLDDFIHEFPNGKTLREQLIEEAEIEKEFERIKLELSKHRVGAREYFLSKGIVFPTIELSDVVVPIADPVIETKELPIEEDDGPIIDLDFGLAESVSEKEIVEPTLFRLVFGKADVGANYIEEKIIVLKGSIMSATFGDSLHPSMKKEKERLLKNGIVGSDMIFNQDHSFRSISFATSILLGYYRSGMDDWKTEDGVSLRKFVEKEMK